MLLGGNHHSNPQGDHQDHFHLHQWLAKKCLTSVKKSLKTCLELITPLHRKEIEVQVMTHHIVRFHMDSIHLVKNVPEATQEAQQLVEKTAAPSPAVKTVSPSPAVVDCSHEEEAREQEEEAGEVDSVLEEARQAASKATKALPAKGWLKTSIKKQRKEYAKKKKEQREAAKAARQAEKDAAKAAKTAKNAQKDAAKAAQTAKAKRTAKACNKRTHANIEDDSEAHKKLVHVHLLLQLFNVFLVAILHHVCDCICLALCFLQHDFDCLVLGCNP